MQYGSDDEEYMVIRELDRDAKKHVLPRLGDHSLTMQDQSDQSSAVLPRRRGDRQGGPRSRYHPPSSGSLEGHVEV